jgi:hypothetical protein
MASLVITGSAASAENAIAALERKYDALEQKIKRVGQVSRQAGKDSEDGWQGATRGLDSMATKLGAAVATAMTFRTIAMGIGHELSEWSKRVDEATSKQRFEALKLSIQAGFTPEQLRGQLPVMERLLKATPSQSVSEAMATSTELAGSGFRPQDIQSGSALNAILRLNAGTGNFGPGATDPRDSVRGIVSLLKATGSEVPTSGDVEKLGAQFSELYDRSTVQAADLQQIAGRAATLHQFGMSREEIMSSYAALTDVMGASKADSALQTFVTATGAAGANKEATKALAELGLKPEDVAIAKGGITVGGAMDTLRGALSKKSAEDQNRLLTEMYGKEGLPAAAYFTSTSGNATYKSFLEDVQTTDKFERNIRKFQASDYAEEERIKIHGEMRNRLAQGLTWEQAETRGKMMYDTRMSEQTSAGGRIGLTMGRYAGVAIGASAEAMGLRPEDVGHVDTPTLARRKAQELDLNERGKAARAAFDKASREGDDEGKRLAREQLEATQQLVDIQKNQSLRRNGQVEN